MASNDNKIIDGSLFEKMVLGAAANLHENVQVVNDLNVFPIPDGDTGENMYLTLKVGVDELPSVKTDSLSEKASAVARGMLLGARGNSGVILSQLFAGLAEGLAGLKSADVNEFFKAMEQGVKCAYKAVAHPVEGTILTVARESVEHACSKVTADTTAEEYFLDVLEEMKKSLEHTPELLAVLKEAGVIDSGGAGLVYITEGFYKVICGAELINNDINISSKKALDFSKFDENCVMEFGYCTEALVRLQTCKTDVDNFKVEELVEFLESIGDSVVAFKTGTIVKLHVHTLTPWKVLAHCQQFGEFLTTKIENMTLQHNETIEEKPKSVMPKIKRARRDFAVVTVASGEGLINTFKEMGADYVISGGQTNNPSSEDFIAAFDEVNADYVFVLPNNSNIILAAKQAAEIYKDSNIRVIETKNIGQGYSALAMLDYSSFDADIIEEGLKENIKSVVTGMVAKSVRCTTVNGVEIKKDDYMGFTDKTMLVSTTSKTETVCQLVDKLNMEEKSFIIGVYGKDALDSEKEVLFNYVTEKYPFIEFYTIEGGQEIYDFLLIVE